MRRIVQVMAAAVLAVGLSIGIVGAQAENYAGEASCSYAPAWPGGSYLTQMHPFHVDFYTRYAEARGLPDCVTWARNQINSAINGLRSVGFTVLTPESPYVRPYDARSCTFNDWQVFNEDRGAYFYIDGSCHINGQVRYVEGISYYEENSTTGFYTYWWSGGESLGKVLTHWSESEPA